MENVGDLIKDYGGYAGLASVLGLAVLSLLYFAQAREVKRLREWAGRAPERAAELEQRVTDEAARRATVPPAAPVRPGQPQTAAAQAAQGAAAPATAPATAAAAAAAAGGAGNGQPGPPAGVPAAKPAATPAAADGDREAAADKPQEGEAAKDADAAKAPDAQPPAAAVAAAPAGAAAATGQAATTAPPAAPTPAAPTPAEPPTTAQPAPPRAPATAAAQAATGAPAPPATGGPPKPGAAPAGTTPPPRPPARPVPPRPAGAVRAAPLRGGVPSATLPPRAGGGGRTRTAGRPRRPLILALAGGVLALAAVGIVLATQLGGGDEPERAERPPSNRVVPPATSGGDRQSRANTNVAVLNGTTVNGLARRVADRIESAGFTRGVVTNASDRNRSATIIAYVPAARREALEVARVIRVGSDAVAPLDRNTQLLAPDARVVVTVGADQNQS